MRKVARNLPAKQQISWEKRLSRIICRKFHDPFSNKLHAEVFCIRVHDVPGSSKAQQGVGIRRGVLLEPLRFPSVLKSICKADAAAKRRLHPCGHCYIPAHHMPGRGHGGCAVENMDLRFRSRSANSANCSSIFSSPQPPSFLADIINLLSSPFIELHVASLISSYSAPLPRLQNNAYISRFFALCSW